MNYEQILEFAIPLILGVLGSPSLIQWIKKALVLEDRWALLLSLVVSFALGIAALALSDAFVAIEWTADAFFKMSALVFSAAQVTYRLLNP
jgi:hypothetical protein